jgi:hypothetical protein
MRACTKSRAAIVAAACLSIAGRTWAGESGETIAVEVHDYARVPPAILAAAAEEAARVLHKAGIEVRWTLGLTPRVGTPAGVEAAELPLRSRLHRAARGRLTGRLRRCSIRRRRTATPRDGGLSPAGSRLRDRARGGPPAAGNERPCRLGSDVGAALGRLLRSRGAGNAPLRARRSRAASQGDPEPPRPGAVGRADRVSQNRKRRLNWAVRGAPAWASGMPTFGFPV